MIISILKKLKKYIRIRLKNGKYVHKGAKLSNVKVGSFTLVGNLANLVNSEIGDYSSIGRYANIINAKLGKFCSVSWNVTIGATSHPTDHISTHAFPYISFFNYTNKDSKIVVQTTVGNDVWFGANAIVLPGLKIGNGAVIGAAAVVTKDVPPYAIVVGNPAKILKYRFHEDIITELEQIEWWNLPKSTIAKNIDLWKTKLSPKIIEKLKLQL